MQGKKIKIAHVVMGLNFGGLETLVYRMVRSMDPERFEPVVICLSSKGPLALDLIDRGYTVHCLDKEEKVKLSYFFKLAALLLKEKVDVVHLHNTAPFIYGGVASVLAGFKKIVFTEHGRIFPDKRRRMLAERMLSWFTYKIVAVSEDMKRSLIRYEKINPEKIQVIYNGVDTNEFRKIDDREWRNGKRKEFGIGTEDIVFGNVGRLEYVKDQATLVRSFKLTKEKADKGEWEIDKPLRLLIIGDGTELENLERLCIELCLNYADLMVTGSVPSGYENVDVIFAGARTDILELLNIMDVFVMSSLNEGLSLTILEAIACGIPVVATRVGGNPEIVKNGINGLLANPRDPHDLCEKIRAAMNLSVDYASDYSLASFSLKKMIRNYERIYRLNENKAGVKPAQ